jgi:DNA polymerase-1
MLPEFIKNPNPNIYLSDNYLVLDCETSNKEKGDASNKGNFLVYGFASGPNFRSISITGNINFDKLTLYLSTADFIVVHGGKFELKWLKRLGYPIHKILIYDTLLGEYVLAGNRKWKLDLDSVSKRYGGTGKTSVVSGLIKSGVCPSEIPRSLLEEYCQQDVRETERVFKLQRVRLQSDIQLPVLFLRCITTPVLADIEMNGIFLDKELVSKVHQECINRYNEIIREVDKITGGINMASPAQVARFLYSDLGFQELRDKQGKPLRNKPNKAFPDGQPLTDSDTILLLRSTNNEQRRFLELKTEESKLRKQLTGYIERFMYACGIPYSPVNPDKPPEIKFSKIVPGSCIIHGELNQSFAQTHRLTSSGPNLQNIDRTLKKAVTARTKKWKIRNSDYKQLEFRAAGILSQDKKIYQDVVSGEDIHAYTSQVLTAAKQPTNRQDAKEHTFKPLNIAVLKSGELRETLRGNPEPR